MPQLVPNRIVIYTKDVENITGKKDRAARLLMQKIRKHFGKGARDFITASEFSKFTGIKESDIHAFLI